MTRWHVCIALLWVWKDFFPQRLCLHPISCHHRCRKHIRVFTAGRHSASSPLLHLSAVEWVCSRHCWFFWSLVRDFGYFLPHLQGSKGYYALTTCILFALDTKPSAWQSHWLFSAFSLSFQQLPCGPTHAINIVSLSTGFSLYYMAVLRNYLMRPFLIIVFLRFLRTTHPSFECSYMIQSLMESFIYFLIELYPTLNPTLLILGWHASEILSRVKR